MRLLLISNRLPVIIEKKEQMSCSPSAGGLATGMRDFLDFYFKSESKEFDDFLWMGWSGEPALSSEDEKIQKELVGQHKCYPVFLDKQQVETFYEGFCNKTIWPLFHYFPTFASYDETYWQSYLKVNELFFDSFKEVY